MMHVMKMAGGMLLSGILIAVPAPMVSAVNAAPSPKVEMEFRVFLDSREIGHHKFVIDNHGDTEIIYSDARFDASILFVPVYRYRHSNTEVWRNGCLATIDSTTDDNGDRQRVNGEILGNGFKVVTEKSDRTLREDCVMTFSYWNPEFLKQPRLLNAQNGEYVPVSVASLPDREVEVLHRKVPARGFRLRSESGEMEITVWYRRSDDQWLALEAAVDAGKTLRYIPTAVPESTERTDHSAAL